MQLQTPARGSVGAWDANPSIWSLCKSAHLKQQKRDGNRNGLQRFVLEPLLRLKLFWPSSEEIIHWEFVLVWVGRTKAVIRPKE